MAPEDSNRRAAAPRGAQGHAGECQVPCNCFCCRKRAARAALTLPHHCHITRVGSPTRHRRPRKRSLWRQVRACPVRPIKGFSSSRVTTN